MSPASNHINPDDRITDELDDLLLDEYLDEDPTSLSSDEPASGNSASYKNHGRRLTRGDSAAAGKKSFHFHLDLINKVVAVLIVLIIAIIVILLFLWNRGVKSNYDSSAEHKEYDIEVQDNITAQNPADLEGHTEDGVIRILYLGNEMITDDTSDTGIAGQIESLGKADGLSIETVTAAFPNSQVTCFSEEYDGSTQHGMDDIFNFFYVANCISLGDFSALSNVAAYHADDSRYTASVDTLTALDFTTIDIIVVAYNGQDYLNGEVPLDLSNQKNIATYTGALTLGLERIHDACPWVRLVFFSPTFTRIEDANGTLQNGDTVDLSGNGTMPTYWYQAINVCCSEQVSFIDNYYGSVNGENYEDCMSDGIHLNSAGNKIIAQHFVYKILENGTGEFNYRTGSGSDVSGQNGT